MDFMTDELFDGRRIRILTIVDHFSHESLAILVDGSLEGRRVVETLALLALPTVNSGASAAVEGQQVRGCASGWRMVILDDS